MSLQECYIRCKYQNVCQLRTQIQSHTSSASTRAKLGRQAELYTCSSHANCGGRGVSERGPLSVPETHGHRQRYMPIWNFVSEPTLRKKRPGAQQCNLLSKLLSKNHLSQFWDHLSQMSLQECYIRCKYQNVCQLRTQIQSHTSSASTRAKLGRQAELYTCSSHANCGGRGVSERGPLSVPETHGHRQRYMPIWNFVSEPTLRKKRPGAQQGFYLVNY